jgi:hypothetical protein
MDAAMTEAEEQNLWARLVVLEERVEFLSQRLYNRKGQPELAPEPPRDRHLPRADEEPRVSIEL